MELPQGKKNQNGAMSRSKYPEQCQKLSEMGFDLKSINDALNSTNGDLQAATAVLLGEPAPGHVEPPPAPKVVAPMKVVGKQATHAPKVAKIDYKEIHTKFMATYKVTKCKDKTNHDKRMCYYWHTKGDRRRNPFDVLYTCTECPNSTETVNCDAGDACLKAHNMLERMFHPDLFKISMCQRGPNGSHCERGSLCAFAHSEEDHRTPAPHPVVKPALVPISPATTASTVASAATALAGDTISAGKSMSDSRMLDLIQEKLVKLIKNQGTEGIISSELPKRYYDAYAERLELADEAGEKFRIKDLLLSHASISVTMHKGVQPKYVYEEVIEAPAPAPAAAKIGNASAPVPKPSNPTTTGFSYSAIATKSVARSGTLNYAAAAAPAAAEALVSSVDAADVAASATARKRGPAAGGEDALAQEANMPASLMNKIGDLPSQNQWSNPNASFFENGSSSASLLPGSPFVPLGGRRRGPDGSAERPDTATPPLSHTSSFSQLSPGNATLHTNSPPLPSTISVPPGIPSSVSSPGKPSVVAGSVADYHERLHQASNTCEALSHQVQALQGELTKRSQESERQTQQLKSMMSQLSESAEIQSKTNSAKDAAVSEMHRARNELMEMKSLGGGDVGSKNRELQSRDATISQLKAEKAADLNQFCASITQIESALVEMQRKEALYINEIPLHETINESSRARDELTKYVSVLKLQLNSKVSGADTSNNTANGSFLKPSASLNSISSLNNLLGMSAKTPETDVFGSPIRSAFSAQAPAFMPNGFLSNNQGSALLHDDFSLDFSGGDSLLFSGTAASGAAGTSKILGSSLLSGATGSAAVVPTSSHTMVCALPGCHAEGTFICSACNRSGYCGAQHQR